MASQILPGVCSKLPKLLMRGHAWRMTACSTASQRLLSPSHQSIVPTLSVQKCLLHTTGVDQMGLIDGMKKRLGMNKYRYKRYVLDNSSVRLYICLTEQIDFDLFFQELQLDDTFNSWFRIVELHVWLLLTRLGEEGMDGKRVAKNLVMSLWNDMDKRSRQLGAVSASRRKEGTETLFSEFRLSLCSYDEGMLSNDMVLAGAVWRTFFQKEIVTAKQLETMVCYIRKQQLYLHEQDPTIILGVGVVSLLPLYGDAVDQEKKKELFNSIIERT